MSKVLIIAEHLNGQLNGATARCVSCAAALNADTIDVLVLSDAGQARTAALIAGRIETMALGRHFHLRGKCLTTLARQLSSKLRPGGAATARPAGRAR